MEETFETLEQAKKVFNQLRNRLLFLIVDKVKGIYMILDEEGFDKYTTKTYISPSHIEHNWKPNLDMEILDIRYGALPAGAK